MPFTDSLKSRRILIVEDEHVLLETIASILQGAGFVNIIKASNGQNALGIMHSAGADLAVLDVNLPDISGFELIASIRAIKEIPVIFLTARDTSSDLLNGFEKGADDYMTKPFLPEELVARVTSIMRRSYKEDTRCITLAGCSVNFDTAQVTKGGITIPLTNKERDILRALYGNANRIMTLEQLCTAVWGDNLYGYENSLMAHIRRLREKIEANPSKPVSIVTVKGIGYKLNV